MPISLRGLCRLFGIHSAHCPINLPHRDCRPMPTNNRTIDCVKNQNGLATFKSG
jgi:hypothetical protein